MRCAHQSRSKKLQSKLKVHFRPILLWLRVIIVRGNTLANRNTKRERDEARGYIAEYEKSENTRQLQTARTSFHSSETRKVPIATNDYCIISDFPALDCSNSVVKFMYTSIISRNVDFFLTYRDLKDNLLFMTSVIQKRMKLFIQQRRRKLSINMKKISMTTIFLYIPSIKRYSPSQRCNPLVPVCCLVNSNL